METFAIAVFPVAKPDEWRAWIDSIASGDRADAHRQMMRRLGIRREHIRYQASPAGDVMVLVWEGVEQDRVAELLAGLVQNPQSEHERYIATHVIPDLHGVDPSAGPTGDAGSRDDRGLRRLAGAPDWAFRYAPPCHKSGFTLGLRHESEVNGRGRPSIRPGFPAQLQRRIALPSMPNWSMARATRWMCVSLTGPIG